MTDEPIERALRDWLADHTEPDVPAGLRRHLDGLVDGGVPGAGGRTAVQPVRRLVPTLATTRRGWAQAIAAGVAVALVGGGLVYGLTLRPGPAVSGSPTPGASRAPHGSASPTIAESTSVVDAGLVDPANGWALTSSDLVWTADGGATWRSIRPSDVAASSIRAVRFVDARMGWLAWWSEADPRVTIERTSDGGQTWSRSHTPGDHPDGIGRVSIEAFDDGTLYVQVESVHSSASCVGELDASTDSGISWLPDVGFGAFDAGCAPIGFRDHVHGWTTAGPLNQILIATSDGGRTWSQVYLRNPRSYGLNIPAFQLPVFADSGRGLDGVLSVRLSPPPDFNSAGRSGNLEIDRTADGGSTWQPVSGPPDPNLPFEGAIAIATLSAADWLVGGSSLGSRAWITSDAGGSWTAIAAAGIDSPIASLRFVDATTGWAIDRDGALHATADAGRTWRTLDPRPTALAEPSPSVPPVTGSGPFTWTPVSSEGELATYDVVQAIHRRNGGSIGIAFGQEARTVHSDDGMTWILDPADPGLVAAATDHTNIVLGIADGPAGLVVVGAAANGDSSAGDVRAWRSTDGLKWQAASQIGGDLNAEMRAVIGGKQGYVAVGSDGFPGASALESGSRGAAVWTSADGSSWARVADQPAFLGSTMTGITATSTGYVAWGGNLPMVEVRATQPPIWTSSDGRTWLRANGSIFARDVFFPLGGIVIEPERWIALGTRRGSAAEGGGFLPGAWSSTDEGRSWTATQ
ncbi:MAG TPA: hypothetical protein VHM48_08625, partial [Candidatus Limnocylindrales bacterium]|nr:hypothetical protein [Candidatus Limnocylindrales bacterium]